MAALGRAGAALLLRPARGAGGPALGYHKKVRGWGLRRAPRNRGGVVEGLGAAPEVGSCVGLWRRCYEKGVEGLEWGRGRAGSTKPVRGGWGWDRGYGESLLCFIIIW